MQILFKLPAITLNPYCPSGNMLGSMDHLKLMEPQHLPLPHTTSFIWPLKYKLLKLKSKTSHYLTPLYLSYNAHQCATPPFPQTLEMLFCFHTNFSAKNIFPSYLYLLKTATNPGNPSQMSSLYCRTATFLQFGILLYPGSHLPTKEIRNHIPRFLYS